MADLDFPTSPSDGDTYEGYVYNAAKGVWQWQVLSPSLVSLTDTDISSPSSGEVLEYDGTNWVNAAAAAGGKVLQVVTATHSTETTTTSSSYGDTGLDATITPGSTASKILVFSSISSQIDRSGSGNSGLLGMIIEQGGTTLTTGRLRFMENTSSGDKALNANISLSVADSPNSTSPVTYKIQFAKLLGDLATVFVANNVGSLILMEVAA